MAKRRRTKNKDLDMAKLIVLSTFLLSFAYTRKLDTALQLSMTILAIGGVAALLGTYFLRNSQDSGSASLSRTWTSPVRPPPAAPENLERALEPQPADLSVSSTEKPLGWSLDLIRSLDWKRFEELCAGYFQAKGRKAKLTSLGADGGVDVLLYGENDPEKVLGVVQCKAWTTKLVGVREIRELLGVMTDVGCPLGVYVASSGYTTDAKAFADGKHINLMDAGKLLSLIQKLPEESKAALLRQTTAGDYTTPSCPSCGIKLISRTSHKGTRAGQSFWGCGNFPRCRHTMRHARSA